MTSSYRATGHASVRATPAGPGAVSATWALDELTVPLASEHRRVSDARPLAPSVDPVAVATERAALIDQAYARGLADGMQKAAAVAQAELGEAFTVLAAATSQMR